MSLPFLEEVKTNPMEQSTMWRLLYLRFLVDGLPSAPTLQADAYTLCPMEQLPSAPVKETPTDEELAIFEL